MKHASFFGLLLLLVCGGCNEKYAVKTTIRSDGSFEKTIVCTGDSLGLGKLPLPFRFKEGWHVTIRRDTVEKNRFTTTAVKRFNSIAELQDEIARGGDSTKWKLQSRIDKRFRWFFTYYEYSETIPAFGLTRQVLRIDSAFTPAEIEQLRNGTDTLLNQRFERHQEDNAFEAFIDGVIVQAAALGDPLLAPSRWPEKKAIVLDEFRKATNTSHVDLEKWQPGAELSAIIARTFAAPSALRLRGAIDTLFVNMMRDFELENKLDVSYTNEVTMPGLLISTNARSIEGTTVQWDCRPHRVFDTTMTAESRTVNVWAIVLTAVVCLVLLAGLLLPVLRRRRS